MTSKKPITSGDRKGVIGQWVDKVTKFSSQYSASSYSANQMCGPPKVYPAHSSSPNSWCPRTTDANQFVEVEFKNVVFVTQIYIYETSYAGRVKAIKALNRHGEWQALYSTEKVQLIQNSRIFSPELRALQFVTRNIRIEIDSTGVYVELDAVQLHGIRFAACSATGILADDLTNLIDSQTFSDVEFNVEDKIVYGHKSIMCVRSDYFRAMFVHDTKDARASIRKLPDITHGTFKAVLTYMYTDGLSDSYTCIELTDIWRAADKFSLKGLKVLTAGRISEQIDLNSVVGVYVSTTSKLPVIDEIKNNCLSFMSNNLAKIVNTPSFVNLPKETILEIIQATTAKLQIC